MILSLKRLREEKNKTPHALAKETGISISTISYLMNGKTKPQVYTVLMLCNVLKVIISELFSDKEIFDERKELHIDEVVMPYITCDEEKILSSYRELSDKKKKLLRIYVDMLQRYDGNYLSINDDLQQFYFLLEPNSEDNNKQRHLCTWKISDTVICKRTINLANLIDIIAFYVNISI